MTNSEPSSDLRRIIIKLFAGNDPPGNRRAGRPLPNTRSFNLSRLSVLPRPHPLQPRSSGRTLRLVDRGPQLFWCRSLEIPTDDPRFAGFTNIGNFRIVTLLAFLRIGFPVAPQDCYVFNDWQSGSAEQRLHHIFIHARGRTETPAPT